MGSPSRMLWMPTCHGHRLSAIRSSNGYNNCATQRDSLWIKVRSRSNSKTPMEPKKRQLWMWSVNETVSMLDPFITVSRQHRYLLNFPSFQVGMDILKSV